MNVRRVAADEADVKALAFRRLAEQHLDASYRLAFAIVRDPLEAQDATHDAFIAAWRRWSTLRDPERFQSWFDRILVNTCRHRMRDRSRHRVRDLSAGMAAAMSSVVPDGTGRLAERASLIEGLSQLAPDHRVVLALRYERDLTVDQIADQLGIRAGTVKSRLHYALRRLRACLERADGEARQ